MLGAIIGDIIGSRFEFRGTRIKTTEFDLFTNSCKFTDDTVMICATANALLTNSSFLQNTIDFYEKYPKVGYGAKFKYWIRSGDHKPYNSYGNGSAMRVSPIGWVFNTLDEVLEKAKESASITHNHPEGIKGAQSTAAAIYLARTKKTKEFVKEYIEDEFRYNLSRKTDQIRPNYKFEVSCQKSVPEAIICFLESESYEECVRLAISLGGDTDTQGAIAGAIAEAYFGIPDEIKKRGLEYLDTQLNDIVSKFYKKYISTDYR